MKKVNEDPFHSGSEHMMFEHYNCDRCVKSSEPKADGTYTNATSDNMPKCSIQRDIFVRMICNEPIKRKTIDICKDFTLNGVLCPYLQTQRKRYDRKNRKDSNQLSLFES